MLPAYKLLAIQEQISNKKAKELIDRGLVHSKDRKIKIARGMIDEKSRFTITRLKDFHTIYQDDNIIAIDKPAFMASGELEKIFSDYRLLHRLDKETSGIILFTKNDEFRQKAIEEFINKRVYKEYFAVLSGRLTQEVEINDKIETKKGTFARSIISDTGKEAYTKVEPISIIGKKTLAKVTIQTGRTHQIRVHLAHIGYFIVGDRFYGDSSKAKRVMLQSRKIKLLDIDLEIAMDSDFAEFGFET
jgi:23S rRNA-/tRNA-specific pseudouridylate synthase